MSAYDYWASDEGLAHITPPNVSWPEGDDFREFLVHEFFAQDVVEFGCGIGRLAPCFKPTKYIGVDISKKALSIARARNPGYAFFWVPYGADVERHTYGAPPADALFAHTVLLHVPDDWLVQTIGGFTQPRVVVSEILGKNWRREGNPPVFNRDIMDYEAAFSQCGYRLHRVRWRPYPHYEGTDLSILEFHRK